MAVTPSAPNYAELANAALSCEAMVRALRLARWVGPGRQFSRSSVLRPVGAMQACRDLDIAPPGPRLRGARTRRRALVEYIPPG